MQPILLFGDDVKSETKWYDNRNNDNINKCSGGDSKGASVFQ